MDWHRMTQRQKDAARSILNDLRTEGVSESVSQVAKYFDDAMAWRDGRIRLATLCKRTGWTVTAEKPNTDTQDESEPSPIDRVAERAARVKSLRDQLSTELVALRADIVTADRAGSGRNQIAEAAKPGLSRPKVFEHLGYTDVRSLAEEALRAVSVPQDFLVRLIERPGGQLAITLDDLSSTASVSDKDAEWLSDDDLRDESSRRSNTAYRHRFNFLGNLQAEFRGRGLFMYTDGVDSIQDIAEGETGMIGKKK